MFRHYKYPASFMPIFHKILTTILDIMGFFVVYLGETLKILCTTECFQVVPFDKGKNPWKEFPKECIFRKLALVL